MGGGVVVGGGDEAGAAAAAGAVEKAAVLSLLIMAKTVLPPTGDDPELPVACIIQRLVVEILFGAYCKALVLRIMVPPVAAVTMMIDRLSLWLAQV
jgi:hypothetical protein